MSDSSVPVVEEVVVVEGLVRSFGTSEALRGLTLRIRAGEIYGLVGPDGAGKTTLLRILGGMIAPHAGRASVLGRDPMSGSAALRTAVGYMPQQYSLYGDLTVEENLRFFSRMFCLSRGEYQDRRERLLHLTRLGPFTKRRAEALSGGMYKKLALACVLLPRPRLLLLDEPTNGVDPVSRRELWALLFELSVAGMAIVITTPYMDEAARCRRVGLIDGGRLLLEGEPTALLAGLREEVLEAEGPGRVTLERLLDAQGAALGVLAVSAVGERVRLLARAGSSSVIEQLLRQRGAEVHRGAPDFEDLFLAAMAGGGKRLVGAPPPSTADRHG